MSIFFSKSFQRNMGDNKLFLSHRVSFDHFAGDRFGLTDRGIGEPQDGLVQKGPLKII